MLVDNSRSWCFTQDDNGLVACWLITLGRGVSHGITLGHDVSHRMIMVL